MNACVRTCKLPATILFAGPCRMCVTLGQLEDREQRRQEVPPLRCRRPPRLPDATMTERKSLFTSTRAVPGKWTGALQAEPVLRITRDRRGGSSALYDQDSYLVKAKLDRLIDAPNPGRRLAGRYRRVPPGREMRSDEALRSV